MPRAQRPHHDGKIRPPVKGPTTWDGNDAHRFLFYPQVERNLLSPYVSPRESPFRHILLGSGPHTLQALSNQLKSLRTNDPKADADLFRNQFALATWTIQGCANSLTGNIWSLYN